MADQNLTNPVLQITQSDGTTNYIGRFGANAEDIQITLKNNSNQIILQCTLLDFFKNWEDFKTNNAFMYYGNLAIGQDLDPQVKLWYGEDQRVQ